MATIKSYTDLQQSKKLAEILPLESADMSYIWNFVYKRYIPQLFSFIPNQDNEGVEYIDYPCWSLASLLGVLPEGIDNNTDDFSQLEIYKNHICYAYADGNVRIGIRKDNLVDACYEMIIKLNELNLL